MSSKLSIPQMQAELARVNAELRKTNARYLPIKIARDKATLENFTKTHAARFDGEARTQIVGLFAALQNGKATPAMLKNFIAVTPVHPAFLRSKIDTSQSL